MFRAIGGFVAILIGVSLVPQIANQVNEVSASQNITGSSAGILKAVPALFALAIVGIVLAVVYSSLRSAGLVGGNDIDSGDSDSDNESDESKKDYEYKPEKNYNFTDGAVLTAPKKIKKNYTPAFKEDKSKFDEEDGKW